MKIAPNEKKEKNKIGKIAYGGRIRNAVKPISYYPVYPAYPVIFMIYQQLLSP